MRLFIKIEIVFAMIFLTSFSNQDSSKNENKTKCNISIWNFDCDSIVKIRNVKEDTLSPEKLINIINANYNDKVFLDFVKVSHDTIYVKIKDSEYLTEQMGTCGADEYMISTTFTLTELKNIRYVNLDFEFGDHASPGTFSRKYYLDWIRNNRRLNHK